MKVTCLIIQEWLSFQLDGPLPESQQEVLEQHLADCGACRDFRNRLEESDKLMKDLAEDTQDRAQRAQTRALAAIETLSPERIRRSWLRPVMKIAALILITVGLVGGLNLIQRHLETRRTVEGLAQVRALFDQGDVRGLEALLKQDNRAVRLAVLAHLAKIGDTVTITFLQNWMETVGDTLRLEAQATIDCIRQRLRDRDSGVIPEPNKPKEEISVPSVQEADPNEEAAALPIKTVTLGGTIRNEDGQPLAGVKVGIKLHRSDVEKQGMLSPASCRTDVQGRWAINGFPEGSKRARIQLRHTAYLALNVQVDKHLDALLDGSSVLTLPTAHTITGVVLDSEQQPVVGADVYQGWEKRPNTPHTSTDPNGQFSFNRIKPGQLVLMALAEGYAPSAKVLEVPLDMKEVVFVLEPGGELKVQVVDAEGQPVEGVLLEGEYQPMIPPSSTTMRFMAGGGSGPRCLATYTAKTDALGWVLLAHLPPVEIPFNIRKQGWVPIQHHRMQAREESYTVTLWRQGKIRGRVLDATTQQPITSCLLQVGTQYPTNDYVLWRNYLQERNPEGYVSKITPTVDTNGISFEITFQNQAHGRAVKVAAEGYGVVETEVIYNEGKDIVCDILLERVPDVNGLVLDPNGQPVQEAVVAVHSRHDSVYIRDGRWRKDYPRLPFTETDAQGHFILPHHPQDYHLLVLAEAGVREMSHSDFLRDHTIRLEPWGRVQGTVLSEHKPVRNQYVVLEVRPETDQRLIGRYDYNIRTNDQGRFSMDRVMPGRGKLQASYRDAQNQVVFKHEKWVEVESGQTLDVNLGRGGRRLTGQLIRPKALQTIDFEHARFYLRSPSVSSSEFMNLPTNILLLSSQERQSLFAATGLASVTYYPVSLQMDGSFAVHDVKHDFGILGGVFRDPKAPDLAKYYGSCAGRVVAEVRIVQEDGPIEMGELLLHLQPSIVVGRAMPVLEIATAPARQFSLEDFRGRLVLLDLGFLSLRKNYLTDVLPKLRELYTQYAEDLEIVSLDVSGGFPAEAVVVSMAAFVEQCGIPWSWGILSSPLDRFPDLFYDSGVYFPGYVLIDRQGKVCDTWIAPESLVDVIERRLTEGGA